MTSKLFTLTLLKAIEILSCYDNDFQEIGIKEIGEMIDMPQSSVYRIIQSLEFVGFIYQNKENKKYRLGPKLLKMGEKVECLHRFKQIAISNMEQLHEECGETVNLGMADCDQVTYIYKVESKQLLRPNFEMNSRYPAYCTGIGKVLLADMSPAVLKWVYCNNQEKIGRPIEEFMEEMQQVAEQGFAYDDEEFCKGLRCVAAPVHGPGGKVLFSISVSTPVIRMPNEAYEKLAELVVKYAQKASEEMRRPAE